MADAPNATDLTNAELAAAATNPSQSTTPVTPSEPISKVDEAAAAAALAAGATVELETTPVIEYVPTGDAGLDLALEFIGKQGIDDKHSAIQAATKGDFTAIEAILKDRGDKAAGYERYLELAKASYANNLKKEADAKNAISNTVTAAVGGAEQWKEIQAWASANATPEEKAKLNAMLTADPFQARAAALLIKGQFDKAPGRVVNPASAVKENASSSAELKKDGPISRREAYRLTQALVNKQGSSNIQKSPEYQAIWSRVATR